MAASAETPSDGVRTFGFRGVVGVFVRTWPFLKPQFLHILCWLALQLTLYTTVGFATLLIDDLLNNKIMLGDPLEPAQATLLLLDPSYAEGEELTGEQQLVVRDRFVLYVAIGAFINTVLMQLGVLHYYYTWIIQRINQRLRVTMVEKAEHLSLRYHSHARTGDTIYRVYQDSATITAIIDTAILDPINMVWKLTFAVFILWLFNPLLGLICLLATVPIFLVVAWYTPRLQHFARLARESNSNLTSRIQESFAAIRVVKANQANCAIALQQNVLFAATVADNIGYASRRAAREDIEAAAGVACADEFIREMAEGYDTELGERGGKLSTGQRQRLSIARAIVRDTPILILDEPTASLDAETEQRLLANLSAWGRERIVFLITHRLSTIRNADQIAFLDGGRIEEVGDHDTLMAIPEGRYRRFAIAETEGAPAEGAGA